MATCMKGCSAACEEDYTPRGDSSPFPMAAIKVDSDEAYKTAAEKSADYIKKNPGQARDVPDGARQAIPGCDVARDLGRFSRYQRLFGVRGRDDGEVF